MRRASCSFCVLLFSIGSARSSLFLRIISVKLGESRVEKRLEERTERELGIDTGVLFSLSDILNPRSPEPNPYLRSGLCTSYSSFLNDPLVASFVSASFNSSSSSYNSCSPDPSEDPS